ncbi:MAG: GOLPH3/VPS74 family protein, partial [Gemmatimonadota bacterium]
MRSAPELRLHEELLLMALDDEKGTIRATNYKYAVCAGLLAELVLEGRAKLERGSKPSKDRIIPADPRLLSDDLLDEVLRKVHGSKRTRSPKDWVAKLSQMGGLRRRVGTGLVRRGIL